MKEHIYILDDHPMIAEGTAQLLMTDERISGHDRKALL